MKAPSRGSLGVAALALLVLLAFAVQMLEPGESPPAGSADSVAKDGRRALVLLLRDLGFRAEAWRELPGALPRGPDVLWLARAPEPWKTGTKADAEKRKHRSGKHEPEPEPPHEPISVEPVPVDPGAGDAPKGDATPAALDMHRLANYRRFVEEGGTLVLAQSDAARHFLVDVLELEDCASVHRSRMAKAGTRTVRDAAGEELEVEISEGGLLVAPDPDSSAAVVWSVGSGNAEPPGTGESDEAFALSVPAGRGQIVLLGDDAFLANGKIAEHDHALLAVRLAEELARGGRFLFDEYALGAGRARTPIDVATAPNLLLVTLNLAALVLLFAWSRGWVREFPRDPEPLAAFSPLSRARAQAALLERAGRWDALGRMLREGAVRRAEERFRAGREVAGAIGEPRCRNAHDLDALARAIEALEREIGSRSTSSAARRRAG